MDGYRVMDLFPSLDHLFYIFIEMHGQLSYFLNIYFPPVIPECMVLYYGEFNTSKLHYIVGNCSHYIS